MKKLVTLIVLLAIAAGGYYLYDSYLGETEEASGPIEATPIAADKSTEATTFEISQADSEVRFTIFEKLEGEPVDVLGITDQVAGTLLLGDDLQLGEITINARTFITDKDRRNRAIRNRILETDDHEFIRFKPTGTSFTADKNKVKFGEEQAYTIDGDLTIRDRTHPVTFEVKSTLIDETKIIGYAETTISRKLFEIKVPDLPFLSDVADEVRLEFEGEFHRLD